MKNLFRKIVSTYNSLTSTFLQNQKLAETSNREYALRGRFYYFPEF